MRNRNNFLDAVDPERALSNVVDPVDGKEIGKEDNWFLRVWNRSPFKVHSQPSKERQFLIDIEFNSSPVMRLSQRGALLENQEITAINTEIGKEGWYKKEINSIMKDAERLTYTGPDGTVYKGFTNIIQAQRRGLIGSDVLDISKFANIYSRLTQAYTKAKSSAEDNLPEVMRAGIREREYERHTHIENQKKGDIDSVLDAAGLTDTLNMAK